MHFQAISFLEWTGLTLKVQEADRILFLAAMPCFFYFPSSADFKRVWLTSHIFTTRLDVPLCISCDVWQKYNIGLAKRSFRTLQYKREANRSVDNWQRALLSSILMIVFLLLPHSACCDFLKIFALYLCCLLFLSRSFRSNISLMG